MALTVETGAGVYGAESYATVAFIDEYWTKRTHDAMAAAWADVSDSADKEGAAREATAYLDAAFGPYFRGFQASSSNALQWPRTQALDDLGYSLPALPSQLVIAVAELAPRAITARLQGDINTGERVKSFTKKIGPIEKTYEYFDAGFSAPKTSYGVISDLLTPILNGTQPGVQRKPEWAWR